MADTVKIQFYPLDLTYKIVDNRPVILIFGRTPDKKEICIVDEDFEPYFYVMLRKGEDMAAFKKDIEGMVKKDKDSIYSIIEASTKEKNYLGKEVSVLKITVNNPAAVPVMRDELSKRKEVEGVFEAHILYTRRYLIDKNIVPLTLHEAEVEAADQRVRTKNVFRAKSIQQVSDDTIEEPKIVGIDIETYNPAGKNIDPEKYPIIMVSLYGKNFRKVITWKRFKTKHDYIEFVDSEADLIARLKEAINSYGPDIIAGYYSDGFDFPYIKKRADKYKINLDIGLDYSGLKLGKGTKKEAKITGINHIDVLRFIKYVMGPTMQTDAFDLNSVAGELLDEKKVGVDIENLAEIWDNHPEKLEIFCEYNLHDSLMAFKLCEKILPNIVELVKIVGLTLYDVSRMAFSQLVESYLLKNCPHFNELAPNKPGHEQIKKRLTQTYKGAFVFKPKPGMYEDIAVFDFRSLYPTIIASHNISPGTINCSCCKQKGDFPPEENEYWFCKEKKGFIPELIGDLIKRRMRINEMVKKKKDNMLSARSYSLKILANSFYGYLGFFGARWYSLESAQAVTSWGRYYIHKVIEDAESKGFDVLYGDTDSIFLSLKGKKKDDALKFVEKINIELPELMELEFEDFYPRGIFVSAKLTGYGAKKKYALLSEQGDIKIRGFEMVRRNWSFIAKKVQQKVIEIILKEKDVDKAMKFVQGVVEKMNKNTIPLDDVVIFTQLQKEIESYDQIGPHVAVAKRMMQKDIPVGPGTMIKFIITKGSGMIRDRARLPEEVKQNDYDPDYYVNNQIIPAVDKIFEVLGHTKEELTEKKSQSKLGSFM